MHSHLYHGDQGLFKIFDFGVVKEELQPEFHVAVDHQYRGSREMEAGDTWLLSPEVYDSDPHGLPADIYWYTVVVGCVLGIAIDDEFLQGT